MGGLPEPRYLEPATAVDVTDVVIQNRHLLRPSDELNDLVLGVFGRAQRLYDMRLCAISVLSTHWHLIPVPEDAEHLAQFMGYAKTNISKEVGRLHDWKGPMFAHRYHLIPIAPFEEQAQIARLKYVLAAGVKEFLVDRVTDWPGIHSATALVEGKPLIGHWYDRTKEYAARKLRGEDDVDPMAFATEEQLVLSPLPCWEHLPEAEWRRNVADLITEIEDEGAQERQRERKVSLGVKKIMRVRPHKRPRKVEKSPKPRFHAIADWARQRMLEAYTAVVVAYLIASERFKAGDLLTDFPEGTFPPRLPFVPFSVRCRGQPA